MHLMQMFHCPLPELENCSVSPWFLVFAPLISFHIMSLVRGEATGWRLGRARGGASGVPYPVGSESVS